MAVKKYYAEWYEMDEYDQWLESSVHDTLDEAKRAAFIGATKGDCHPWCEVSEQTPVRDGYDMTLELINHHDFGNKWSGWISKEKYQSVYT